MPQVTEKLFDPLQLNRKTESIVINNNKRKYLRFGTTPDYRTGISTGYAAGCNLRCAFCWANETRDDLSIADNFYAPDEVFEILQDKVTFNPKIDKIRISDGESTIGRDHLLGVIQHVESSKLKLFVVETNGINLGNDESYVKELSSFKKVFVRVSLKGGTPESYSRKTRAFKESFELPFQAISFLKKYGIGFGVSAMSADPRFMDPLERIALIVKLGEIDPEIVLRLEEEMVILFPTAKKRLIKEGWNLEYDHLPFYIKGPLKKFAQKANFPLSSITKQRLSFKYSIKNYIQLKHGI